MDHLRHHRNLVNPACLLSFKEYCLSKGCVSGSWLGSGEWTRNVPSGSFLPRREVNQGKGLKHTSNAVFTITSNILASTQSESKSG